LEKMPAGPWDEDFIVVNPGEEVRLADFFINPWEECKQTAKGGWGKVMLGANLAPRRLKKEEEDG